MLAMTKQMVSNFISIPSGNCTEVSAIKCSVLLQGAKLSTDDMGHYSLLVFVGLAAQLVSGAQYNHKVECGPVDAVCECDPDATVCSFEFYVEYVFTFAKYNTSIRYSQGQGELFYINDTGNFISFEARENAWMATLSSRVDLIYTATKKMFVWKRLSCVLVQ